LAASGCASPSPLKAFSQSAFEAAQTAGSPILIDVAADWCPTCRAQAPTLAAIIHDPAFANLKVMRIDFDSQIAERRRLGVEQQSTLIAFRGKTERERSTGQTDPESIRAIALSAMR
jgi:thiol-disulfide isomerase/thioredoxin